MDTRGQATASLEKRTKRIILKIIRRCKPPKWLKKLHAKQYLKLFMYRDLKTIYHTIKVTRPEREAFWDRIIRNAPLPLELVRL